MVELVFGDSACGGLKAAKRCGEGAHAHGGAGGMGGNPADVYGLSLMLSIGDISENILGANRLKTLEWLYSNYPDDCGQKAAFELLGGAQDTLKKLGDHMAAGETIRIWYSNHPDELCGLFWFMSQLSQSETPRGQIGLIKLPDWEADKNGHVVQKVGWGEVAVEDWPRYLPMQKPAPAAFWQACAAHWRRLQTENAPLRAMLNGHLGSAPETLYDYYIIREIEKADAVFNEARIIGQTLANGPRGLGDAWIALRIEEMVRAGKLEPVTEAGKGDPMYHRKLKKRQW